MAIVVGFQLMSSAVSVAVCRVRDVMLYMSVMYCTVEQFCKANSLYPLYIAAVNKHVTYSSDIGVSNIIQQDLFLGENMP